MLTHIAIKNFVIVDALHLDFNQGFNVLTGETGAGKSIWVDAVALALGHRADSNVIREGTERCDITLCFDISQIPEAKQWLQHHDLEQDDECIIRRLIHRTNPSRCTINGSPCTLQMLREFAQTMINIHGQHQHQTLLKRDTQRQRVDEFANNNVLLADIYTLYQQWQLLAKRLDRLQQQANNRDAELNLLQYQLNELQKLNLQTDEWQTLSHQHQQLHNAKHLMSELNQALELTVDNEQSSATQLLQQAILHLETICKKEPQLKVAKELLTTAAIHLEEAGSELNQYRNALDLSPENLATIEQRLTVIHDLARKHHVNPDALIDVTKSLEQKIDALEKIDIEIDNIKTDQQQLIEQYNKLAKKLTKKRQQAADILNKKITTIIQDLGINGGKFQIELTDNNDRISPFGNESVCFMISTNPGQTLQPMAKIVSGGELSRISLALQVITANQENTPTLIFDEVDVGIGGKTAAIVGKLLRQLGEKVQVLCITHLPQVAALGHHHYCVIKSSQSKTTSTQIRLLTASEREAELARMLGGTKITAQTRAHAKEMLITEN